jgi:hypothetical protein
MCQARDVVRQDWPRAASARRFQECKEMTKYGFLALAALTIAATLGTAAFADFGGYALPAEYPTALTQNNGSCAQGACPNGQGCNWVIMYNPNQTSGAGPGCGQMQGTPIMICPGPCCPAANASVCGTFCAAGQTPPGWPYGWCDQYWLRPNSNY